MTYAQILRPYLSVWLVADLEPTFDAGHVNTLAEQKAVFAGRRYAVVAVTVESDPRPGPIADDEPVRPRLHYVSLHEPTGRPEHLAGPQPARSPQNPLLSAVQFPRPGREADMQGGVVGQVADGA